MPFLAAKPLFHREAREWLRPLRVARDAHWSPGMRALPLPFLILGAMLGSCGIANNAEVVADPDTTGDQTSELSLAVQLSPAALTFPIGETADLEVSLLSAVPSTRKWVLSVSGLPEGVTAVFEPTTLVPGSTANLKLVASSSALVGSSRFQVRAASGFASHIEHGDLTLQPATVGPTLGVLLNGVPINALAGSAGSNKFFVIDVPAGAKNLHITTQGGLGNVSLYVKQDAVPTGVSFDCRPHAVGNAEACDFASPTPGTWHVVLKGTAAYSDLTLLAQFVAPNTGAGGGGGAGGGSGGGSGSGIGPNGGTVDKLHFALTGDTRPPACEDTGHYPTPIIEAIADAAQRKNAQFGLDLGDHMYVCNHDLALATAQMKLYTQAVSRFSGTWFMTMGNHECFHGPCLLESTNANYVAYMNALAPVSSKPYYAFNIETSKGRATFVIIADNGWDSRQAAWLEATLAEADSKATYTIVARHHPSGDNSVPTNAESIAIVRAHKFALLLTGHDHSYKHMTTDQGRDLVIGIGGAPLIAAGSDFNGYAMIDQLADGRLQVTIFNINGDLQQDSWTVGPNQ